VAWLLDVYENYKDGVSHPSSMNTTVTLKEKEKVIYKYLPTDDVVLTVKFIENFDKKIDFDTQHKPAWMP